MMQFDIPSLFHTPKHGHYFLTHSIGLQPKNSQTALQQAYLQPWQQADDDIWPSWLDSVSKFKQSLAQLLNSSSELFCPQANVSSGLSKILMSLPKRNGKRVIVASETDFPSVGFVLKQAESLGYSLRIISQDQDLQNPEVWSKYLQDDVIMALITHAQYSSNKLNPIDEISTVCKEKEIISVVDAAQSVGITNLDLKKLDVDVLLASSIKWLCGGPGAGFLWVNQDLIKQLEPMDVGWFSHQNPFEFDINNFEYAENASRLWGGTPSIAPFICATNSIGLILDIGLDNVISHNRRLSQTIMNHVPEECISSPMDLSEKGGTVVLKFPCQTDTEQRLSSQNIMHDAREHGIRLSPHIYTTEADMTELLKCFV